MSSDPRALLDSFYRRESPRLTEELFEFLRFPSVSTDPAYRGDCAACAEWVRGRLSRLGFSAETWETPGHPTVFAERPGDAAGPTVLYYGHYDVQPPDPLPAWTSPPFTPVVRGDRVFARGAEDNKGQTAYVLAAIEALVTSGVPLPPMKVVIEGDEECGSVGLAAVLAGRSPRLAADVLMVCDTGTPDPSVGAVVAGLRGLVAFEWRLHGPKRDLHSGVHGGVVTNPAAALCRIAASLHAPDGSVAVPGFYDGVAPPDDRLKRLVAAAPFDAEEYEKSVGTPPAGGERRYSAAERRGLRPTVEINGLYSGYTGSGGKTIVPATAGVKYTARLVPGQDPRRVLDLLIGHVSGSVPEGLTFELVDAHVGGPALSLDVGSPLALAAKAVLEEVCGEGNAVFLWEGASIPVIPALAAAAGGAEPLLVGFGLEEDAIHAPDESFSLTQYHRGFLYAGLLLARLGAAAA